jgi:hypothetical protein
MPHSRTSCIARCGHDATMLSPLYQALKGGYDQLRWSDWLAIVRCPHNRFTTSKSAVAFIVFAQPPGAPRLSIIVVPFQNLNSDSAEDYLADAIAASCSRSVALTSTMMPVRMP